MERSTCLIFYFYVHLLTTSRYSVHLVDTVKIDHEKGICLTEGVKATKDVLFFINSPSDDEKQHKSENSANKKQPAKSLNGSGSPAKNKVVGGKVLRSKTRSAAQEDLVVTTSVRIAEHQKELHEQRHRDGLAKYAEDGVGLNNKEGKGWKRFQSYKGEAGLPKEVESMRVRGSLMTPKFIWLIFGCRFLLTGRLRRLFCLYTGLRYPFTSTQ